MGSRPGYRIGQIRLDAAVHSGIAPVGHVIPFHFVPHEVLRDHVGHVCEREVRPETEEKEKVDDLYTAQARSLAERDQACQITPRSGESRVRKPYQEAGDKYRAQPEEVQQIETRGEVFQHRVREPFYNETDRSDGSQDEPDHSENNCQRLRKSSQARYVRSPTRDLQQSADREENQTPDGEVQAQVERKSPVPQRLVVFIESPYEENLRYHEPILRYMIHVTSILPVIKIFIEGTAPFLPFMRHWIKLPPDMHRHSQVPE